MKPPTVILMLRLVALLAGVGGIIAAVAVGSGNATSGIVITMIVCLAVGAVAALALAFYGARKNRQART